MIKKTSTSIRGYITYLCINQHWLIHWPQQKLDEAVKAGEYHLLHNYREKKFAIHCIKQLFRGKKTKQHKALQHKQKVES